MKPVNMYGVLCPTCQSDDVRRLELVRHLDGMKFIVDVYHCNACEYRWEVSSLEEIETPNSN